LSDAQQTALATGITGMSEKTPTDPPKPHTRDPQQLDAAIVHIRQALAGLQFGEVSVIVQDGVIVQVERIERKRFRRGER
jgi:hypothetical protein